jgi:hypothetical protein
MDFETNIDGRLAERIVSAARTGLGDELRSVIYFTPSAFDLLYLRSDLYGTPEAARRAKSELVDIERVGFAEVPVRSALVSERRGRDRTRQSTIGPYEFTVRFHADGFVARILNDDSGVLLTTDALDVDEFRTAAGSITSLLSDRD